ncbi:MAG: PilW family protein, partial [Chlorobium sp.]|nr:PilW family protein [Chlorobium sp.]
ALGPHRFDPTKSDDLQETITYSLKNINGTPVVGDPPGSSVVNLVRDATQSLPPVGPGPTVIAENISRIEFRYLDQSGTALALPLVATTAKSVRSIQVSLLVRASQSDPDFNNTQTYVTPGGTVWGPFGDNFRRRFITMTINCRNLGI